MTASEQEARRQIEERCRRQEVIRGNEKQANGKNGKHGKKKSVNMRNEDMENEEEKQVSRWSHVGA